MTRLLVTTSLTACLIVCGHSAAHADLSLGGAVGLPLNATAQLPPAKGVIAQAGYYDLGSLSLAGVKFSDENFIEAAAAKRVGNNLELSGGVSHLHASDPFGVGLNLLGATNFTVGAKYLLTPKSGESGVNVAIGAAHDRALLRNTRVYVVASKLVHVAERAPLLTAGVRYDHFTTNSIGGPASSKYSLYGGIELPLDRAGTVSFVGELQSDNNDLGRQTSPYSLGLRYQSPNRPYSAGVGYERLGVFDGGGLYAKVGYTFGAGK